MGCGSVCSGFDAISEREEVWGFVNDCLTRDNVRALRQVLEVPGLAHRYPFLLRRALELGSRNDASRPSPPILVNPLKCVEFLSERHITSVSPEISPEAVSTLTRDRLAVLLKSGAVQPNSWVFAGVERASEGRPPVAQPLLIALIDARKFDSAAALMDAGARVDVCEWVASVSARGEAEGAELTFPLDYSTAGRSPLHALVSTVCEERAERLRFAADRGVDIDSDGGESSLAEGGRDVVGEQDREKNAVRLALLRRIAVASQEAGCFHWAVKTVACRVWMDKTICNALSLVSLCGDFEGLRVLLEAQGCLRPSDRSLPFTAVAGMVTGYAKRSELLAVLKVLAERGMDFAKVGVGYFFRDRVCLLSLVCRRCSVECAEFLLQRGAPVNGGGGGMVPLIESLQNPPGGGPITSLLLQWGADANQIGLAKRRTLWGQLSSPPLRLYTPLQLIATSQLDNNGLDAETVVRTAQLLIDHGARCSQTEETNPPSEEQNDAPPRSRVSPLHAACMCSLELVRLLCEKGGADPNIPGVHDDDPPVSDLQDYPVPYVVSVPYLAGTRVMLREWQNRPDQMMARVVEVLAESGADLNRRLANDGHSPLSLACRRNMKSTAEALVRKGAAVNGGQALGRKRRLPLSEALVFSPASHSPPRFSLVSLLLQAGADPNEIGLFEPPQPLSLPATRAYPLQAVMYRLVAPAGGPDSEREVAELTKLLVHAGARCAPRALLPDSEASEGVGVETQQLPEQSRISPLLFACCMRDSALVRFLCESGGADPNASGVIIKNKQVWEMGCPLAAVLTHRRTENASMNAWCEEFYSDSEDSGAEWDRERELEREANMALKKSWILVETLVEVSEKVKPIYVLALFPSLPLSLSLRVP
uniref:Uncharacterized protein n=1 Tax=Chromera velia CCMP2878 TaxID=1169474 RepID=A0A0G4I0Y5_9ALVE|eukprot:Cvel_34596.t1-p1 / transcript=Cvel_34596.t1 / gene=Cvel_34596 / organism=Chromera_velia_CCMP2878 / gene_product=hypothetical protein / transcript_product=hypothetical protein / location=Cvel_scaffold5997:401-3031(-) / protein_length=877 / sequence_SO=supercontig / SO=protein_coding / is_pseudo=false